MSEHERYIVTTACSGAFPAAGLSLAEGRPDAQLRTPIAAYRDDVVSPAETS